MECEQKKRDILFNTFNWEKVFSARLFFTCVTFMLW